MQLPLEPILALGAALLGALAFDLVVGQHRNRRLAQRLDRLATDEPETIKRWTRPWDRRVAASIERLEGRLVEARTLAATDLLTGLLNRQTVLTRLEVEAARAARYGRPLSVALIDLDHFKRINDTYGHLSGDLILHQAAALLARSIRSVDIVGRYGGEEFLLILPEVDVEAASTLAEKLRRAMGSTPLEVADGDAIPVTISIGLTGGMGAFRLDDLVRDADAALYAAKSLGRDQVYIFRASTDDQLVHKAAITVAARNEALEVGRAALGAAQDRLTQELESRAPWAGKPSIMIAQVAETVARAVGLPEGEVERIKAASLLHDLGKLAIPDEILSKPGDLDEHEWRTVTEHPRIGQVILEQAGALRDAATIVVHHHEWFDGRGYPHGLTGREIPVGSRIVSIADAYEAMVSGRPYRDAISHEAAIAELRRYAGIQFDPELVEVFTCIFAAGVPWSTSADEVEADRQARGARSKKAGRPGTGWAAGAAAGAVAVQSADGRASQRPRSADVRDDEAAGTETEPLVPEIEFLPTGTAG